MKIQKRLAILLFVVVLFTQAGFTQTKIVFAQEVIGEEGDIISDWNLVGQEGGIISGDELLGEEGGIIPGSGLIGQEGGIIPGQNCQEIPRDFPQCGGTVGLEGFPATDTLIVTEFVNTCGGSRFEVKENKGNLGQCQQGALPSVPSQAPSPPTQREQPQNLTSPGMNVQNNNTNNNNPTMTNNINMRNDINLDQNQSQSQNQVSNSDARSSTGPININVSNPAGSTTTLPTQVIRTVPQQTVTAAVPRVVQVAAATLSKEKELPKTGPPLIAWALAGLIPAGLRLRRFGYTKKKIEDNAHFIWQIRELRKQ